MSRAPQANPDAVPADLFASFEQPVVEPFPVQALHACRVLAHVLQRVPRPESVQLFTADHWSSPWLQVHLYPDPDDAQLAAYQHALGGRLTRSRSDGESRTVVYSELATVVDRVRIQVWNVNEHPLPTLVPTPDVRTDEAPAEPLVADPPPTLESPAPAPSPAPAMPTALADSDGSVTPVTPGAPTTLGGPAAPAAETLAAPGTAPGGAETPAAPGAQAGPGAPAVLGGPAVVPSARTAPAEPAASAAPAGPVPWAGPGAAKRSVGARPKPKPPSATKRPSAQGTARDDTTQDAS
ncbi:hypothetical protein [Streptacidiphilus sp. MAP12-33]|uniref:hypothetical protein n=1 Tax=Streptacidiphilus sp. MAP12-33 TaxID=3156266 RepID=UPI0035186388